MIRYKRKRLCELYSYIEEKQNPPTLVYAGFLNNQQNGLDLWNWDSHNEIEANIAGFHAVQTFLLFRISKSEGHFTPEHKSFR